MKRTLTGLVATALLVLGYQGQPAEQPETNAGQTRRLIAAVWDNDLDRARRLIARGADVNAKDETEQSAYLVSTSEGYLRLLELTPRNGARVQSKDRFNGTGLIRAAERGHNDIVGRLVQTRIEVNHVNNLGWTALHEALILGDGSRRCQRIARILLDAGADPSIADDRRGHAAGAGPSQWSRRNRPAAAPGVTVTTWAPPWVAAEPGRSAVTV